MESVQDELLCFHLGCEGSYKRINVDEPFENADEKEHSQNFPFSGEVCPVGLTLDSDYLDQVMFFCKTEVEKLPESIKYIFRGAYEELSEDCSVFQEVPAWLDMAKIKKGQEFAQKHFFAINYGQLLSLMFLFSPPNGIQPLVYTNKSHTPFPAFKRYLSTAQKVTSWYETEFWKPGSKGFENIKNVRALHLHVSTMLNKKLNPEERRQKVSLEHKLKQSGSKMWCPLIGHLRKDFAKVQESPVAVLGLRHVFLNQMEMSVTQFGFFGLLIAFHKKLGADGATREELEGFVHLWRYIGYLLGVRDQYNICNGTFEDVFKRSQLFVEYLVKPTLLRATNEWEHMSRCAVAGIESFSKMAPFEAHLLYLCWLLDIDTQNVKRHMSYLDVLSFNVTRFLMCNANRIPGFKNAASYLIRRSIKQAENFSAEKIQEISSKKYY